jgi:hypothetical protein
MTGSIAYWIVGGVVALFGLGLVLRAVLGARTRGRHCRGCTYSMVGVPGLTCPECGRVAADEAELLKHPRRGRRVTVGVLLLLLGALLAVHGEARRRPNAWWSLAPRSALVLGYWATGVDGATWELHARLLPQRVMVNNMLYMTMRPPAANSPSRNATPTTRGRRASSEPARWQRRLIAERSVREEFGGGRAGPRARVVYNGPSSPLLDWALQDEELATDLAIELLRSPRPDRHEMGYIVAAHLPDTVFPVDDRLVRQVDARASDPGSAWRDAAYGVMARIEPFQGTRLEAATRACVVGPDRVSAHQRWSRDLEAATDQAGARAVEWLVTLLSDPDPFVRSEAAACLGHIGTASGRALDRLFELLDADLDIRVREAARRAIYEIDIAIERGEGAGR